MHGEANSQISEGPECHSRMCLQAVSKAGSQERQQLMLMQLFHITSKTLQSYGGDCCFADCLPSPIATSGQMGSARHFLQHAAWQCESGAKHFISPISFVIQPLSTGAVGAVHHKCCASFSAFLCLVLH